MTTTLNDALELFADNLADIRFALLENAKAIIAEYSPYSELDIDTSNWTTDEIELHVNYLYIQEHVAPLLSTIKRIDSYRYYINPQNQNNNLITDVDIHKAKSVDKDWFIQEAELNNKGLGRCPFHQDTNPSLNLMKSNKGTYYLKCFSCGWFGDSIKYIQDRDGLSFIEAVKRIIC